MEISQEQLQKLIKLSGCEFDKIDIDDTDISRALIEIERKLNYFDMDMSIELNNNLSILIVDDLELSIYQLSHLLKRLGITPSVARNKEEAIAEIKKKKFDYLIIDLFLPDPKDGLKLISDALAEKPVNNFKIIVISSTDDKKIIEQCYELGIDEFISKTANWHESVLKYVGNTLKNDNNDLFTKYTANDKILVYTVYKLNNQAISDSLLKDVNASIYTGSSNIVFNLDKIKQFDPEFIYIFTDIYKSCSNQGGKFIILTSSDEIETDLENAFLDGIIPVVGTIEEAIHLIEDEN